MAVFRCVQRHDRIQKRHPSHPWPMVGMVIRTSCSFIWYKTLDFSFAWIRHWDWRPEKPLGWPSNPLQGSPGHPGGDWNFGDFAQSWPKSCLFSFFVFYFFRILVDFFKCVFRLKVDGCKKTINIYHSWGKWMFWYIKTLKFRIV